MNIPRQPPRGTYLLLARLARTKELTIGRLGTFAFPGGWYAYAGSALGPGGIHARLARHERAEKRLHWHIDYLLTYATLETSWQIECPIRLECAWAMAVRQIPSARIAVPGFGASDCGCSGHLVYLSQRPTDRQITNALRSVSPEAHDIQNNLYPVSTRR